VGEMELDNFGPDGGINISQKHKTFLWLWSKCGTTHMKQVLDNFDFKFYRIKNGELFLDLNSISQNHRCLLFNGHENYKVLAAIRNPYSKFFSEFTFTSNVKEHEKITLTEKNIERFTEFLEDRISSDLFVRENCCDFLVRTPDYIVRVENLYEDYMKIPFVVESDYFKSGELKEKTKVRVNVTNEDENLWKKFYTQNTADLVYYRTSKYFELFGYDKNSWKK
jgi:hypothetical protein